MDTSNRVIPAKAGIQNFLKRLDSRFCGNDKTAVYRVALLIFLVIFIDSANAYYPSTLWSSNRINDHLIAIKTGSVMGDGGEDIVTLGRNKLTVYRVIEGQLFTLLEHQSNRREKWFKLSLFDLEGDGQKEIILSGLYLDSARSVIGKIKDKQFQKMGEVPYYLTVIPWREKNILAAQKKLGGDDFSGPLMEMTWNGKELVKKSDIPLSGGISGESISLYSVSGFQAPEQTSGGFLQLSPTGKLIHFVGQPDGKFKKGWISGEAYNGAVTAFNVEEKRFPVPTTFYLHLPEPVVTASAPVEGIEPVPVVVIPPGPPQVFVMKNYGYLKSVVGVETSVKNSQMVRLVWTGYGFQEDWNSPRLDGAISDFDLVDWDGDGKKEILAALLLRDKGYVDTLKNQDSLLIVLKPEK